MTRFIRTLNLAGAVGTLMILTLAQGCASAASSKSMEAQPDDTRSEEEPREIVRQERARIEALQSQLGDGEAAADSPTGTQDRSATSPRRGCEQTCNVAGSLCESTATICEIADEHPTEAEFKDSCSWAQDSCDNAKNRCQQCGGAIAEDSR